MKTAMHQLRDKLIVLIKDLEPARPNTDQYGYRSAMGNIVKDIDAQMLDIEKEIICEAFVSGDERGTKEIPFNAEQYYTQTFKP